MQGKRKFSYRAFGLNILSNLRLPELSPGEGKYDAEILCEAPPVEFDRAFNKAADFHLGKNTLLFSLKGVGHFYVESGRRIFVLAAEDAEEDLVRQYLLGTALGALLLQRGVLPIHGSAVIVDGRCIIFTGVSKAGKSTLCSAFRRQGCQFLSDDVSAVTFDPHGTPWVQPGYPQQKLCGDSIGKMGGETSGFRLVDPESGKYAVPAWEGFSASPARLAALCELKPQEGSQVQLARIFGVQKLEMLLRNIYRAPLIHCFRTKTEYLGQCVKVAEGIAFYRLTRPEGIFSLESQISAVRGIWGSGGLQDEGQ